MKKVKKVKEVFCIRHTACSCCDLVTEDGITWFAPDDKWWKRWKKEEGGFLYGACPNCEKILVANKCPNPSCERIKNPKGDAVKFPNCTPGMY